MVRLSVTLSAEVEEVKNIYPSSDKIWFFKLKCSNCLTVSENFVGIDPEEKIEQRNSTVNLLMKCKSCTRENTVSIEQMPPIKDRDQSGENNIQLEMARFDCRGIELEEFDPRDQWTVVTTSGKEFHDADLSNDWSEYDDSASASICVLSISSSINKIK
ncbi:hypothetical protein SAMD00019534_027730 [Acytostelium subglobosum LB1]|uniref:hypothetical protein n=1 Tax=Acytostelium subglobosum LB1 TaxID=1410327 RepID=UPI0006450329|nr:hypothetical protein SAMD00019534_027730 [Acytostelium subglobosum LB1]GAM19598.1 hypothetical protein SAMD00019534_027730 [Acytostelium subglobosum LB1]|eukprot:XP_012756360.1 hypothetical protein SAMD00019534_027730 [Acytostelium subglobosum LB1]